MEEAIGSSPISGTISINSKNQFMKKCLVLDQSYTPRSIITAQRAFIIVFKGNADIVHNHDEIFKLVNPELIINKPSIIRVPNYIRQGHQSVPLTRENIFKRDDYKCVYCGEYIEKGMSLDHVIPRSKGGKDTWENLVTSCMPCNFEKDNLTIEEWGKEHPKPKRPHYLMMLKTTKVIYPEWRTYLEL